MGEKKILGALCICLCSIVQMSARRNTAESVRPEICFLVSQDIFYLFIYLFIYSLTYLPTL